MNGQQPIHDSEKRDFGQVIKIEQDRLNEEVYPFHHKLEIADDGRSQVGSNPSARPSQPESPFEMRISVIISVSFLFFSF